MPGPASGHATRLHLHIARGQPDGQKICSVFPRCGHIIVNTLMNDTDAILLQRYTRQGDEAAFRALVERYAGLVFSSALRHTGNAALAEEAAQNTFALLAHRAATRPVSDHLAGWLHHTSCLMARHLMRGERRRIARESAAAALTDSSSSDHAQWDAMHDVLDETLQKLPGAEREALLLRYFRGLSLREVGESLHTSEDAARMRIARGLERLRGILARRGITSTTAALTGAFASCAAATALPAEFAARTAEAALTLPALPASIFTTTATMTAKAKLTFAATGALLACTVGIPVGIARERTMQNRIAEMQQQLDAHALASASAPPSFSGAVTAAVKPSLPSQPTTGSAAGSAVDSPQIAAAQAALDPKNPGRDMLLKAAGGLMKIPGMKEQLTSGSAPLLSESEETRLMDLMFAERQAAKAAAGLPDPENDIPSDADVATFPARREAIDACILKEAATFLNPAQTKALAASLTVTRESESAQINIANGIMGTSAPPAEKP